MGKGRSAIDKKTIDNTSEHSCDHNSSDDYNKRAIINGYKKLVSILLAAAFVFCFRGFVMDRVIVSGPSMEKTFYSGDVLWVKKYDVDRFERFEVAIADTSYGPLIKRVIGLPHETVAIKEGKVYIDGAELSGDYGDYINDSGLAGNDLYLDDNEYFLLGDNRNDSIDSRLFGVVNIKDIRGKVIFQIFPFSHFGKVDING